MVKAASKPIEGEYAAPDFEHAIRVIKNDIDPSDEKGAKVRGDMAAAWKVVEDDCHCNKKGAKTFRMIRNMSSEVRDDYLRTLYGLMAADGIGISQDMVQQMEGGTAPTMPVVANTAPKLATVQ